MEFAIIKCNQPNERSDEMGKSNKIFHTVPKIPAFPLIVKAKGIHLYSAEGTKYWDLFATPMACTLGYGNEEMADFICNQLKKTNYAYRTLNESEEVLQAAVDLEELTGGDFSRFFLVSGGSEAVEGMIKIARQYWLAQGNARKYKILTRMKSYHGSTNGALAASGHKDKEIFDPYMVNMGNFSEAFCYRCPYSRSPETCNCECALDLERQIQNQGADTVAAVMIETISGGKLGIAEAPPKYYKKIREICDKYNVLLMYDEIYVGSGRAGARCTYKIFDVIPDIICWAKAISGGYYPVGAIGVIKSVGDMVEENVSYFEPGYTWCMNPVGAAVVSKTLEIYKRDNLIEKVAKDGEYLRAMLNDIAERHECIGDVRGRGFMFGIEYVADKKTKEPIDVKGNPYGLSKFNEILIMIGMQKGIQFLGATNVDATIAGPQFITSREDLATMMTMYEECLYMGEKLVGLA
jgi:adenosylmethionine-8-amino-7-oxononanoate aminotransferase